MERRFRAKDASTGSAGVCALDLEGQIWCQNGWGNGVPFPGADTTDIRTFVAPVAGDERYTLVGSNSYFACGLSTFKHVLCWGSRILRDSLSAGVPTPVASSMTFDTLSIDGWWGCGLSAGTASCWGGESRRVRNIDTGSEPLVRIAVQEYNACGWTASASVLCWNEFGSVTGEQPLEPTLPSSPVLHGIANGGSFFCGLDADSFAWCWGTNGSGQLGNGALDDSAAPVQVAGGHRFQLLTANIVGSVACGITDSDELFCWGARFGSVPAAVLY